MHVDCKALPCIALITCDALSDQLGQPSLIIPGSVSLWAVLVQSCVCKAQCNLVCAFACHVEPSRCLDCSVGMPVYKTSVVVVYVTSAVHTCVELCNSLRSLLEELRMAGGVSTMYDSLLMAKFSMVSM